LNTSLPAGVAVSVTEALGVNDALQVPLVVPLRIVHAIPAGLDATDPLPSPAPDIVRTGCGVTVKVARSASVPPLLLETTMVAVYVPVGRRAGFAPTLIVVPVKTASSHRDGGSCGYVMLEIATPDNVPLPLLLTVTSLRDGLAPPETPENSRVLGDSCNTGFVLNLALTPNACPILSVHEPWPEQAPPQPPNASFPDTVAVRVTEALGSNGALQAPLVAPLRIVHAIPAGADVTDPLPSPAADIVRTGVTATT
jgi:hypothetical protein